MATLVEVLEELEAKAGAIREVLGDSEDDSFGVKDAADFLTEPLSALGFLSKKATIFSQLYEIADTTLGILNLVTGIAQLLCSAGILICPDDEHDHPVQDTEVLRLLNAILSEVQKEGGATSFPYIVGRAGALPSGSEPTDLSGMCETCRDVLIQLKSLMIMPARSDFESESCYDAAREAGVQLA